MTKAPEKQKKKPPFLIDLALELLKGIREEFTEWFIETPKGIASAPWWKQLYQWPLYLGVSFFIILLIGIAIIFAIAAIPS